MPGNQSSRVIKLLVMVLVMSAIATFCFLRNRRANLEDSSVSLSLDSVAGRFMSWGGLVAWWDPITEDVRNRTIGVTDHDNISPESFAGPESCRECHEKNYTLWSEHPHRWMNALADEESVRGDFSGDATISYRGGTARFFRAEGENRMELTRGSVRRLYRITQTIGSRFFQYYVGKGLDGPEPVGHEIYSVDHVLPFGYWLEYGEWVPTVHIHSLRFGEEEFSEEDLPSEQRPDPFAGQVTLVPYYNCNSCHTTFPLGDQFIRAPDLLGRHTPRTLHVAVGDYLKQSHPEMWETGRDPSEMGMPEVVELMQAVERFEAPTRAVALGVTCEACHLGSRAHAEGILTKPSFFPQSPHLRIESEGDEWDYGNSHDNVNWACGRCHAGVRSQLAAGMSTWNSTEYSDAMLGSCYTELTCVDCHNPHEATGARWSKPAVETDRVCLQCHQQFESAQSRTAHTHHAMPGEGAHCMDCHMPRINEGLQDVVRTHMIYSPTDPRMIEANHPNACNLCHTDQSIDWTLVHLRDWYDAEFSESELNANYRDRTQPATVGWLESRNHSVRLIGADALTRADSDWALPELIEALDDPILLNRQFARRGLENVLGVQLRDHGYEFYMTREERAVPMQRLRDAIPAPGTQD